MSETSTHTWNPDTCRWKCKKLIEYDERGTTAKERTELEAFKERHLCYLFPRWFELADIQVEWIEEVGGENVAIAKILRRLDRKIEWLMDRVNGKPIPKGQITPDMKSRAREHPVESILSQFGHEPDRNGKYLCVYHEEKTPSMNVYNNRVKCFGCDKSDNAIGLYMHLSGDAFPPAVRHLCGGA